MNNLQKKITDAVLIVSIVLLFGALFLLVKIDRIENSTETSNASVEVFSGTTASYSRKVDATETQTVIITTMQKDVSITSGELNALQKAYDYLDYTSFSYKGLMEQLEYEGFTTKEATYAVNNCGANWNEQAAKKAKSYLDYTSFSREGLIEQLEYEGFTQKQAEYGVSAVGY